MELRRCSKRQGWWPVAAGTGKRSPSWLDEAAMPCKSFSRITEGRLISGIHSYVLLFQAFVCDMQSPSFIFNVVESTLRGYNQDSGAKEAQASFASLSSTTMTHRSSQFRLGDG